MSGIVENPRGLELPSGAADILQEMFADYGRVVIKQEFGGGLSGSRVFLVRPIRIEAEEDRPELPVVVKLAPVGLIQKEWRAYQRHIRHRLMGIAEVRGKPVVLPGSGWGGLCYPLLGGGTFEVVTLNQYCREARLEDIEFVLGRLLKIIEQMIRLSRPYPEFHLRASYDRLLPVNLLIEPCSLPLAVRPTLIKPEALPAEPLQPGDYLRLEGFTITEVEPTEQTVTLNLSGTIEGPAASYRLRLYGVEGIAIDQVDQIMPPLEGVVIETCLGRLRTEAQAALGQSLDLAAATVPLPDGRSLPNPLARLAELLDETRDVKLGRVHGDMNLENILVDPEVRDVNLIDFSEARRDHVLHDFLYLEMEVMTKLIPEILHQHRLPAGSTILQLYEQLHQLTFHAGDFKPQLPHSGLAKPFTILQTIRQTARRYLLDYYDCSEYYQGLTLYLLGALKFKDLSDAPKAPLPKQVAFWGAATLVGMLSSEGVEEVQRSSPIKNEAAVSLSPAMMTPAPPQRRESPLERRSREVTLGQKLANLLAGGRNESRDRQNRQAMLKLVKDFWVKGVLESSLHGAALIELGLEARPEAVDRPWEMVLQTPDLPHLSIPAGTKMVDVFNELDRSLLILGEPGSGKTTMLLELARDLIDRAEQDPAQPMPIVFNLSSWAESRSPLAEWLVDELNTKYNIPKKIARPWVETDALLLLLDGLDEVAPKWRAACVQAINQFRQEHLVPIVVCCRVADYETLTVRLKLQGAVLLQPLTSQQVKAYLDGVGPELVAVQTMLQEDATLQELTQTPLMLSVMTLAYRGLPVEDLPPFETTEARRRHLFDTYLQRMFERRGADDRYSPQETTIQLSWLAKKMSAQAQTVFLIEQLQPGWLPSRGQRWAYTLGSRIISAFVPAIVLGLVLLNFPVSCLSINLPVGLIIGVIDGIRLDRSEQRAKSGAKRKSSFWSPVGNVLGLGVTFWLAAWLIGILIGHAAFEWTTGLVLAVFPGLLFGLLFGLRWPRQRPETDIQPVEGFKWAWKRFLISFGIGLMLGGITFVYTTITYTRAFNNSIILWDGQDGQRLATLAGHSSLPFFTFSPDGSRILIANSLWSEAAWLWDGAGGHLIAVLEGPYEGPFNIVGDNKFAFSPDGNRLITVREDGTAQLWDTTGGQLITVLEDHPAGVRSVGFSPDGARIVTTGKDRTAQLWDGVNGRLIAMLEGHSDWVESASFSPDGARIVTAGWDGTARLWDGDDGQLIAVLEGHPDRIRPVDFSPDGNRILTVGYDDITARLWDGDDGRLIAVFEGHLDRIRSADFSPDGNRIVTSSQDGTARLWDGDDGQLIVVLEGRPDGIRFAIFSPDGNRILTVGDDKTARLWDGVDGRLIAVLEGHSKERRIASFSPEGFLIAGFSPDGSRIATTTSAPLLGGSLWSGGWLDFSSDGARIVTTGSQIAQLWDGTDGQLIAVLAGDADSISSAGRRNLLSQSNNMVRLWDSTDGTLIATLAGHTTRIVTAAFTPDNTRIVSSASLWDFRGFSAIWVVLGLIVGLLAALRVSLVETKTWPNQGMRLSVRNALLGLLIGGILGIGLSLIGLISLVLLLVGEGLAPLLDSLLEDVNELFFLTGISGSITGSLLGLWYGGLDVIQHYTLRFILWRRGYLPWNLVRFLDYAAERIFLRKVGGGYIFVHRLLLEYFAGLARK